MGYPIHVNTFGRLQSFLESVCTLFTSLAHPQHTSLKWCASKKGFEQARFSTDSFDHIPEFGTQMCEIEATHVMQLDMPERWLGEQNPTTYTWFDDPVYVKDVRLMAELRRCTSRPVLRLVPGARRIPRPTPG